MAVRLKTSPPPRPPPPPPPPPRPPLSVALPYPQVFQLHLAANLAQAWLQWMRYADVRSIYAQPCGHKQSNSLSSERLMHCERVGCSVHVNRVEYRVTLYGVSSTSDPVGGQLEHRCFKHYHFTPKAMISQSTCRFVSSRLCACELWGRLAASSLGCMHRFPRISFSSILILITHPCVQPYPSLKYAASRSLAGIQASQLVQFYPGHCCMVDHDVQVALQPSLSCGSA